MMKKFLIFFLLLSTFAQAQWLFVSDFTLSLAQAPNSILDSTIVMGNSTNALIQSNRYMYDWHERLVEKKSRDVNANQNDLSTFIYDTNDSLVQKTFASGQPTPTFTMVTLRTRNLSMQVEYDTVLYRSGSQYTLNNASIYTYDNSGNISEIVTDSYNGSWAPWNRKQYTYNTAGKLTNSSFQGWVNNAWDNISQIHNTYNGNGDRTDRVLQFWNGSPASWKNSSRERSAYTGAHLDTLTTYSWNNAWINLNRYTYSPDAAVDSVTLDSWNGIQWEGSKRYIRTWSQGKLTSVVERGFSGTWQTAWKRDYIYDSDGNHTVTNLSAYNNPSNPWVLLIVTNHYYRMSTVGIAEKTFNNTKTYPVPSAGMLYFDSALPVKGGTVYSTNGLAVISFEGSSVDLSPVTAGVYYVKLLLGDGNFRVVKAIRE